MCNMTTNMTDISAAASQSLGKIGWDHPNIPFAILISLGAGLSTGLGGSLVFLPEIMKRVPQATVLAISLALSAGVMIYVSFIEIFAKSYGAIAASPGISESGASAITTVFFFLGMLFCVLLELIVHKMSSSGGVPHEAICAAHAEVGHTHVPVAAAATRTADACCDGERCHNGEESRDERAADVTASQTSADVNITIVSDVKGDDAPASGTKASGQGIPGAIIGDPHEQKALHRMGLMTAAAIAIHNFPEGLATFLATVSSPKLGASLGVAIAVHNIPEGLCVAMPIYYATGSMRKGFFWSVLSGLTEPIGGILGFAVLQPVFTGVIRHPDAHGALASPSSAELPASFLPCARQLDARPVGFGSDPCIPPCALPLPSQLVFGIIFSMVGGMMVFIVCHELLPAAHRYMGNGAKATMWLMIGMLIMAVSLVLFVL